MRLDLFLFKNNFTKSRNQSLELIKNGFVSINDEIIIKPSFEVESSVESKDSNLNIKILKKEIFVSRAGEKLDCYLKEHKLDLSNLDILDIGSSKGGFAQVALKYGARSVTCVDVGINQLDSALRNDSRIYLFEGCDIKDFKSNKIFDYVLCDVSFISLSHIINYIYNLARSEALLLFKPQFEVGRLAKRSKKGVVLDKKSVESALEDFLNTLSKSGFEVVCIAPSKIRGKEGNEEIFINIKKK